MQEVVKKEIVKLLDTGIIYPIADSPLVSPIHCVPKKCSITVVTNENDELVSTRIVTGWRANAFRAMPSYIPKMYVGNLSRHDRRISRSYLAETMIKDCDNGSVGAFPIRSQASGKHHQADNFIFGISVFKHIANSEEFVNVFVRIGFGSTIKLVSFDKGQVVAFNGKFVCDFRNSDYKIESQSDNMVGSPHGFIIHGIEVDCFFDRMDSSVSSIKSLIQNFLKIARPLSKLVEKDTPFKFDDECQKAFELLKEKLTCAPMIVSANWNLPFELMCDASDFAVGVFLGQKDEIKDRKGRENVTADHLSRIENEEISDDREVDENFSEETLMEINTRYEPWFTDFANYLVADIIPKGMTYQQKNKFFSDLKH
nr:hypothetical protein [Tanacetum cinerariifolium]